MKRALQYTAKSRSGILHLIKKSRISPDERTLHDLRVEIKKLNAFLELLEHSSDNFKRKKFFLPFKILFKLSGKIREIQIMESLFEKYLTSTEVHRLKLALKKLKHHEEKTYFSLPHQKIIRRIKKTYEHLLSYAEDLNSKKIAAYFQQKHQNMAGYLRQPHWSAAYLHDLRKQLKKWEYNQLLFLKSNEKKFKPEISRVTRLIGNRNNHIVFLEQIETLKKTIFATRDHQRLLKKMNTLLKKENKTMLIRIRKAVYELGFE